MHLLREQHVRAPLSKVMIGAHTYRALLAALNLIQFMLAKLDCSSLSPSTNNLSLVSPK